MKKSSDQDFKVSVIIPVYNAAKYVTKAVESAVHLDEVGEIILVEDGSPDNALEVCQELMNKYSKVKLFTHPNGKNLGAGASRNVGIRTSTFNFIAFLDADDWYLPNRFKRSKSILSNNNDVDGVYEATGYHFYNQNKLNNDLSKVKVDLDPQDLLLGLLTPETGRFTTDAITFRRSLLTQTGLFNESLRLHQDTHLWLRMAYCGTLLPGENNRPVAIRGVHQSNRISNLNKDTRAQLHIETFNWFRDKSVSKSVFKLLFKKYIWAKSYARMDRFNRFDLYRNGLVEIMKSPGLLLKFL